MMDTKEIEAIAKLLDSTAWPFVALVVLGVLVWKAPSIVQAIKRAPLIKKITFQGFELELDLNSIDELQEKTERSLSILIDKTNKEIQKIIRISAIDSNLAGFGDYIYRSIAHISEAEKADSALRCTLHIPDAIFTEYLYQISNYYNPWTKLFQPDRERTTGRRFSVRYGIIGLAARTETSQVIGNAMQGDEDDVENLISHWSMTPSEARNASAKPSCLAIVLRDPRTSKFVGIFYADAAVPNFFCPTNQIENYCDTFTNTTAYEKLLHSITDVTTAVSQMEIAIDLKQAEHSKK